MNQPNPSSLIDVDRLTVSFHSRQQRLTVIDNLSFSLPDKRMTALVGESGCGKSVLALALFGLLPSSAQVAGRVLFRGTIDLLRLTESERHRLRGDRLVLVPQNPMSHLDPTLRIDYQVGEGLKRQGSLSRGQTRNQVLTLLGKVGFERPAEIGGLYPHQLSGGMAQRVLLAIGLAGTPELMVADEPTRGLDASNQQRYLSLVRELARERCLLMITHNLDIAKTCDRIMVMYGGEIVETGDAEQVLNAPRHPYTQGLLKAHPNHGLHPIPGRSFSFAAIPTGCRFHPRCAKKVDICARQRPALSLSDQATARCFHAGR